MTNENTDRRALDTSAEEFISTLKYLVGISGSRGLISKTLQKEINSLCVKEPNETFQEQIKRIHDFFSGEPGKHLAHLLFGVKDQMFLDAVRGLEWTSITKYARSLEEFSKDFTPLDLSKQTHPEKHEPFLQEKLVTTFLRIINQQIKLSGKMLPENAAKMLQEFRNPSIPSHEKISRMNKIAGLDANDPVHKFVFVTLFDKDQHTGKLLKNILKQTYSGNEQSRLPELSAVSSRLEAKIAQQNQAKDQASSARPPSHLGH